ncbi:outer membrane beta-barrel family protein [Dyadobacter psychrophilus]|uniref:Outer membrane receptor proteins, mostly Fe transport n=1 Tax=Dyadobacter psychrophilus TaxID=651661 RepID=A0A1T5EAP3_9BACT|nr:outer membrane beta-barrel family protein [Dyadobacter psychrophilus]SKB80941.1 Outer membrane receptor proteins, mostly Fe transport [Dyadobacter psychrophilus]
MLKFITIFLFLFFGTLPLHAQINIPAAVSDSANLAGYTLTRDSILLNSVVIRGEKVAVQYHSDKMVLNIAGNSIFKTSANAMDILRKAPGVAVNPDGTLLLSGRNNPVIFINGKPVEMSPEESQAYLNSLNPDQIETIEIISNPSSRYDGRYKAIIDIRLKSDLSVGWKGNLNTTFRQNIYALSDNSLNLAYKTKKVNYTLRGSYLLGHDYYQYDALQRLANKNYMTTNTWTRTFNNNPMVQLGADYALGKNQHLEITLKTYHANRKLDAHNTLTFADSLKQNTVGINQTENRSAPTQRNYSVNGSYDIALRNGKLTLFGSLAKIGNRQNEDIQIRDVFKEALRSYWKTALRNDITIRNVQLDYIKNLKKATLEAGAKYVAIATNNDLKYDTLAQNGTFAPDAGRTNRFLYREYITAAYASYVYKFSKLDVNMSLRTEQTRTIANAVTEETILKRDYFNWLPGANISYAFNDDERLSLAFTKRITRPNFDQLNPFRFYLSPLNYRVGNPNLRPSVTSSVQLSYSVRELSTILSLGREKDFMVRYPEYNPVTNDLLYLGMNLPFSDFASLETSYTLAISRWWKATHNVLIYYNKQEMPYLGKTYAIGVTDFTINGSQVFNLVNGFTLDATYRYKSRSGSSLYIAKSQGNLDLGLQKSWRSGKLSTKLNVYDIFYTHQYSLIFREKSIIDNQFTHRFKTRRVALTLTYNFGKADYSIKKSRTNVEEGRAGN